MRIRVQAFIFCLFLVVVIGFSDGLRADIPRYPGIRDDHNRLLPLATDDEQLRQQYRTTISRGRHSGARRLQNMFGDLHPSRFRLSLSTPGVSNTLLALASDNKNLVKGHARAAVYANALVHDGRLKVLAMNEPRRTSIGKTDADIVAQCRHSGRQVRLEVKDATPRTQRANLADYQLQMRKMAMDARKTGEIPYWLSRHPVLPVLQSYAEELGISVESGLRTKDIPSLCDRIEQKTLAQAKFNASLPSGLATNTTVHSGRPVISDIVRLNGSNRALRNIGVDGSMFRHGSAMLAGGTARQVQSFLRQTSNSKFVSVSKWGGRAGIAGTILAEGFLVSQYLAGEMTERQFWHGQASLGGGVIGGVAGGIVGAKAGATIGAGVGFIVGGPVGAGIGAGIGAMFGSVGGGISGGVLGSHLAGSGMDYLHNLQDKEQQEQYVQFLLLQYASN